MFHQSVPQNTRTTRRQSSLCLLLAAALLLAGLLFIAPAAAYAGSGTQEDPYRIITESDLWQLSYDCTNSSSTKYYRDTYFRLEEDIRLTSPFTSINNFHGHFDGAGHLISNLTAKNGLFARIEYGSMSNLGVQVENISTRSNAFGLPVGGLAGGGYSDITNCYAVISGSITVDRMGGSSSDGAVGGLVGAGYNITNSYAVVYGSLSCVNSSSGTTYVGGLVGYGSRLNVTNSYAVVYGSLISNGTSGGNPKGYAGGIAGEGYSGTSFQNCVALVSTLNGSLANGHIIGLDGSSSITNSYAWDKMTTAPGSPDFRSDETYATVTSDDALNFSWWTEKALFNTDTWTETSYYALPSHKNLPPAPALPDISFTLDAPPVPLPETHISLSSSSVTLDPAADPLVQMFHTATLPASPVLKYSAVNRESTAVSVPMISQGSSGYSATATGLLPKTTYHWWVTASPYPFSLPGIPFTTPDVLLGTPEASSLTATGAKISVLLLGELVGSAQPLILYSTGTDPDLAQSVPAIRSGTTETYYANLDGLLPGTTYNYWAQYGGVTHAGTPFTTDTAEITLGTPALITTGPGSVTVEFTATVPDGAILTDPGILYGTDADSGNNNNIAAAALISASRTTATYQATITGLDQNRNYYFRATGSGLQSPGSLTAAPTLYTLADLAIAGDPGTTTARITFTLENVTTGAAPAILYGTAPAVENAISVPAVRTAESGTAYHANLNGLTPQTPYYIWAEYNGHTIGGTQLLTTAAAADATISITADRISGTTATFSITTEHGDGAAPILSYWTDPARKYTATATPADAGTWTVTVSDLLPGTAYNYSANYSGITASGTLPSLSPHITITSPADAATGISTSPLLIWTISDIDPGTTIDPVITLEGGAGDIIGTTNTGETGSTRTYQTALRGLLPNTPYTITIEYGRTTAHVSFTTAASPAPVTLNPPVLMAGTLTETAASFLIKLDNITDNPGAVFLYYNTREDAGNATAIAATPGTTTGTTRGYYASLDHLAPGTLYYIWSWIDGTAPAAGTPFTTEGGTSDVTISGASDKILLGTTAKLTANRDVIWTSSNPAALQIDSATGEYTAKKVTARPVTITAEPYGATGKSDSVQITITDPAPSADNTQPGSGWNARTPAQITYTLDDSYAVIRLPALTRGKETILLTDITIAGLTEGTDYRIENGNILLHTPGTGTNQITLTATGRKLGDTDRDGTITSADALIIAQYIAETRDLDREDRPYADVLPISGISVQDALAILEMNVGYRNPDYTLL